MNTALGRWGALAAIVAGAAWLGCSSDSGTTAGDGGADAGSGDAGADVAANDAGVDAGDGGTTLPVSCDNYCSLVTLACTGRNAAYTSKDTCLGICARMTIGAAGDTAVDTVGCRQGFAAMAQGNPSTICPRAGLTGADSCGPHCAAFCKLDVALCGTTAYADEATCETACAAFPYDETSGDVAQTGGAGSNTMNCRIYHLEAAYANDGGLSSVHCPHTAVMSATCVN